MNNYSKLLLRLSALFGFIGAFLGSHMAGAGDYAFRPIHAHILVVGWLTLFAWAVYYKVFSPKIGILAKLHVYTAIIGSIGLTGGMALYIFKPAFLPSAVNTILYIVGGSILLLSFLLFFFLTFTKEEKKARQAI
ncbi:hypothetical protein RRV45_12985 [Bacillus sp. DTU_2020_1000418_1_SI_GHA_SEK_038]|uniref:hypothetical protein n=1 Tax=Bacillus sp. DTU_2020_1000418_1_SI_GHA_SEK_038 TaxID=3077585 RepID=UPI0028F09622|nr:hypothetical protein [Bacillus sp. DTU_2020_1000418_1_SI_GHA_SEK_038]WNS73833.1 hypothetical protein RRV45_12985 [Bacillus sp. DTU_2020_1000418_1_SI_GHA_SEK_038]